MTQDLSRHTHIANPTRPSPQAIAAKLVRIAPRGRDAQALAHEVETEIEAEWAEHLGAGELARLHGTLLRLREITDPYRPTHD